MTTDLEYRMSTLESLKEENEDCITVFVEITLNRNQVETIESSGEISVGGMGLFDYYKNKIDNKLVLKSHESGSTCAEDNYDFQSMIDCYIESLIDVK